MDESKRMYKEAEENLYKKGYYVDNMVYDDVYYEVADKNGKILIDNLSLSQLCQLSEML